jgi:hypothetical protein
MVNGIDTGTGVFYVPPQGFQIGGQVQGPDNASADTDVKNKDLGPKECKT